MNAPHQLFDSLKQFDLGDGRQGKYYSLPALEQAGLGNISRLPVTIRIVLESVLRNYDGRKITAEHVKSLAGWQPQCEREAEIPFQVARIVLQDFTGVPLLVDLAAMRSAADRLGRDANLIEPLVPVDLVVDHSVQVDFSGSGDAFERNLNKEFERNRERYEFLKWGMQAFKTFKVIPPGIGIVHQVNLEYLAKGVLEKDGIYYPDTLVGTDSHTTMINGLGVVGWGVGGIEAEAGMLGQPIYFLIPDVVGVYLHGELGEGITATDLALTITEMLRSKKVVGKFVEFYGPGASGLSLVDRATIANMAPEYGATMGFFPMDDETVKYLAATGRTESHLKYYESYYRAQELFGMPEKGSLDYTQSFDLDLGQINVSVAGPKRPQDRILLSDLKQKFRDLLIEDTGKSGFGKTKTELEDSGVDVSMNGQGMVHIDHGSVLIAAITSCTNTSNPGVMLAAGLLAKNACNRGLSIGPSVKTSLAPGSRVVSDYLEKAGLQTYLDQLGFHLVGYGCTTCIGNSGPLFPALEQAVIENDLIVASVLSGNRNFEARVHQNIKSNFLMSPPLVVAFALAGRVDIDFKNEPISRDPSGEAVYLKDLWPTLSELRELMKNALLPETFLRLYSDLEDQNPQWNEIPAKLGNLYQWNLSSTYIQEPPFFKDFGMEPGTIEEIKGAKALGIFGDSVTTDHISPAGAIKKESPAGRYLAENGVEYKDFNSYGSRRGNDRIMTRGTFANIRIKNLMIPGSEGGITRYSGAAEPLSIYDAAVRYREDKTPLIVLAGHEYGTGSSRDWAAKGTRLLGVRVVVAASFERIHRSNLVGMGVLPVQFPEGTTVESLAIDGSETYDLLGLDEGVKPRQELNLIINRADGRREEVPVICRIDTPVEIDYYRHGGILPFVLRQLVS